MLCLLCGAHCVPGQLSAWCGRGRRSSQRPGNTAGVRTHSTARACAPTPPLAHPHSPTHPPTHSPPDDLEEACAELADWLGECGAAVAPGEGEGGGAGGGSAAAAAAALDCKASTGALRMPEEKTKVAHGDENLSLDDFLKSCS